VVVPTDRRPVLLRRCLDALAMQRLAPAEFEIVVVDDGHDETTAAAVRDWALTHPRWEIRCLRPDGGHGPAVARNCGWRAARAPLIAFTDDDTLPTPEWLLAGLHAMDVAPWVACAGRVIVPSQVDHPAGDPSAHDRNSQRAATTPFDTANAFVRRSALALVGGFDERFRDARREDQDLQYRLQRDVGEVHRCHDAVVLHVDGIESWGDMLRRQRNVFFDALLYREHPERYRAEWHAQQPWTHHAIVGLAAASVGLGLAGHFAMAGLCLSLALLGIVRFAMERLHRTSHAPGHLAELLITSALIPFLAVYWRWRGAWHFRVWFP
jgi:glycosyltransferase involved in cell wall biosynthesis